MVGKKEVVTISNSNNDEEKPGQGRRVLVVDDSAVQRKLLERRLDELGFQAMSAQDGAEALEMARGAPPDAIVSDVVMPRLDGFGLCRAIRQDPKLARIPFVLTSATEIGEADLRSAQSSGANAIVLRAPGFQEIVQALFHSLKGEPPKAPEPRDYSLAEIQGIFFAEGQDESRMLVASLESGFDLDKAKRIVHRWIGRGGTLGFPQISEQASKIESLLRTSAEPSEDLRTGLQNISILFTELAPAKSNSRKSS